MSSVGERKGSPTAELGRTGNGVAGDDPIGRGAPGAAHQRRGERRPSRPWRSIVFAPVGDGATRRRGSDGLKVVAAVIAGLCCWLITYTPAASQTSITEFLTSAPSGVQWVINTIWWVGSIGTVVALSVLALVSRRANVARDILVSGGVAYVVSLILVQLIGPNGAHAPSPDLSGINLGFPLARVAGTIAVACAALPYLSRSFQRLVELAVAVAAVTTVIHGSGLPIAVLASLAIGWGTAAVVHLVFGSPLGLPSGAEVGVLLADLGVHTGDVLASPRQVWGVARFAGSDGDGPVDISVYGRDAHDAQLLAKTLRFIAYRDSGPTLTLTRVQQVEHEAFINLMAERTGARCAALVAAGRAGPSRDAVLVTRPPPGTRLSDLPAPPPPTLQEAPPVDQVAAQSGPVVTAEVPVDGAGDTAGDGVPEKDSPQAHRSRRAEHRATRRATRRAARRARRAATDAEVAADAAHDAQVALAPRVTARAFTDAAADDLFRQVLTLHGASISHGSINPETVVVAPDSTVGLVDFRNATVSGRDERIQRDLAAALVTVGQATGAERAVASAVRVLPAETLAAALPFVQRAALDSSASKALRGRKPLLAALREQAAEAVGVEVPKLAEPRRISWVTLVMIIGSLIGGWALIAVLINVGKSWSTITGADWGWVAGCFLLSQLVYPAIAITTTGSIVDPLRYGRVLALEVSNTFVSLAGGTMAVLAARVRFFQQDGYDATLAVSSGAVCSTASWIVKGALFLIALPIALPQLHFHDEDTSSGGSDSGLVWLILVVVIVVVVGLGLVFMVPRLRRMARNKLRPKANEAWSHLTLLAAHPRNLVEIFGGSIVAQLLVALALGTALHAFGDHLSLAVLLVVLTLGSMLGGVSPVPGGMGVVEAGMIIGLTAAGISESDAVAAVFVQRLFTAYLPPIWGWFVLVWMRKKEYL